MISKNQKRPELAGRLGESNKIKQHCYDTTVLSQRASILYWFSTISIRLTTMQARNELGIMSPAARILELRREHNISLEWIEELDANGIAHKMGVYIYLGLKKPNGGI
jgi:hypothetical protein